MTGDPAVIKKRFDDAYRTLLAVSGIFAFAFSNYAREPFASFIYKIGIPFVLTAVVIWAIANITYKDWEYKAKFAGFILTWFATFGLLAIVYMKDLAGTFIGGGSWLIADIVMTLVLVLVVGKIFVSIGITTKRYTILMIAFTFFIGLGSSVLVKSL